MAGRSIGIVGVLGLLAVPLACGGRSEKTTDGAGTSKGAAGGGGTDGGGTSSVGAASGTGGTSVSTGGGKATGGTVGTSTGGAGAGPTLCGPTGIAGGTNGYTLVPDCNGWIETRASDPIFFHGGWYSFGDQFPGPYDERCTKVGMHNPFDCSLVSAPPPPPSLGFPQTVPGEMCTMGEVAVILPCAAGVVTPGCPEHDYGNMTGAGIAVDFYAETNELGSAKHPVDFPGYGIIGFSFEIDTIPAPTLRVEIPMLLTDDEAEAVSLPPGATTDQHPDGSPYWGATSTYPASPVMPGVNRVLFGDIHPPRTNYEFETSRMLGIEFHVPAVASAPRGTYAFCIKNLTLLTR